MPSGKGWGRDGDIILRRGKTCRLPDDIIEGLLEERQEARQTQDYETADAIREDLAQAGVALNELEGIWATSDGRTGYLPQKQGGKISTAVIYQLLRKRARARQYRDFDTADDLRVELEKAGVSIDDSARRWSHKDGREGPTDGSQNRDEFWGKAKKHKKLPG
eukprot:CAMPEP_0167769758 /NCGR_PEP_ID=MMETSP0110_2-20121227/17512_1 /TAXON_ID=629695 /ORGANISM="Gymnochlora sp., Strain CCMP2014" /LENGTH=162 /DNA_ID=CAMNT_0007658801 /DNA_START=75 /DNA_END=560 /DNA_ORIENTATION=-